MYGAKMRTKELKTLDPAWDEIFVLPVVCARVGPPSDIFVEFNIKDTAVGVSRPWSKRLAQVKLPISDFPLAAEVQDRLYKHDDIKVHIHHIWCEFGHYEECEEKMRAARSNAALGATLRHEGLDCGAGCHNALARNAKRPIEQAKRTLDEAMRAYEEEKRMDRLGDNADRQGDRADRRGDQEAEEHHQRQEDHYDRREEEAERRMERRWDDMRRQIRNLDSVLRQSCGATMPDLGVNGDWLSYNFRKNEAHQIGDDLREALNDVNQGIACLRRKWFDGEYAVVKPYPKCSF